MLQNLIERNPMADDIFKGLGSKEEEKGFSDGQGIDWY
jgi:hypothetical protein